MPRSRYPFCQCETLKVDGTGYRRTRTAALTPRRPSKQLAKDVMSRSTSYVPSSAVVLRSRETGAEKEARNERRVLVPKATLASNVSAPPKTFRMRPVAL